MDVVCKVTPVAYVASSAYVQILVQGDRFGAPWKAYTRDGFGGDLTEIGFVNDGGGLYHVTLTGLSTWDTKHVVFRFKIPYSASTSGLVEIMGACYEMDWDPIVGVSMPRKVRLVDGNYYLVFANRTTMFRDHDENDMAHFLGTMYIHSQSNNKFAPRDKRAAIYYVDHYRTDVTSWDNTTVNYSSEYNANTIARYIQWVIWDKYYDSESPEPLFFLLVGNDEQFPMYRMLDPYNDEWNWYKTFPGGHKGNPAIRCCLENYYFTDNFYAYIPGGPISGSWKDGNVDVRIGRIIGDSAADMEQLYLKGLSVTGSTGRAVIASVDGWDLGYEPDDGRPGELADYINVPARLASKNIAVKNDAETPRTIDVMSPFPTDWNTGFKNAANGGLDLFFIGGHNSYTHASIPGDDFDPGDIPSKYTRFDNDNPIVMIVGCHGGLPVPSVGWVGGISYSMVYGVIHDGARAYFGASGFSYGSPGNLHKLRWGELFLQYVFYHFIKGTNNSYNLGTGIRSAKINYPFGISNNTNLDKKTVTEFNLFGIPWQILNYPSSGGKSKTLKDIKNEKLPKPLALEKKLMHTPRKVMKLASDTYEQVFEVNTASWKAEDFETFQIIEIPEGQQQFIPDAPLLPAITSYSIALPPGGEILSISVDEVTTSVIGDYNIPTVHVSGWTEGGISLSSATDINYFYPPERLYSHEGMAGHTLFSAYPIRHNPTSDETVFHNHMRVTVEYKAPVPFGILNFAPDTAIFTTSELPSFSAQVFNTGDTELSFSGNLSIVEADTMTTLTETTLAFPVLPGGIYNLECSSGISLPKGDYFGVLAISHAEKGTVMAQCDFSVESVYLSDLSAEYVLATDLTSFAVNVSNLTEKSGTVNLAFNIMQEDDLPIATVFASSIILNGESSQIVSDVWNADEGTSGTFKVEAVASFDGAPLNSVQTEFTVFTGHEGLLKSLLDHLTGKKLIPLRDWDISDVNLDGKIDIADVIYLLKQMAG